MSPGTSPISLFSSCEAKRSRRLRYAIDRYATWLIVAGGLGVIASVLLITLYLLSQALPLFQAARMGPQAEYPLPAPELGPSLYLAVREETGMGLRITAGGAAVLFSLDDGAIMHREQFPLVPGGGITQIAAGSADRQLLALGLADGSVLIVKIDYQVQYSEGQRALRLSVEYPLGRIPLQLLESGPVGVLGLAYSGSELLLIGQSASASAGLLFRKPGDATSGTSPWRKSDLKLAGVPMLAKILITPDTKRLFLLDVLGGLQVLERSGIEMLAAGGVGSQWEPMTDIALLSGGDSLIGVNADGEPSQWFISGRGEGGGSEPLLVSVRHFDAGGAPVQFLIVERHRKGFVTLDTAGHLSLFHATAARKLLAERVAEEALVRVGLSSGADRLLLESVAGRLALWQIHNDHPEVSWRALWGGVWYEGYSKPEMIWQSSGGDSDYEAKYSLAPLVLGTLKAALCAMLVAAPLAIGGAIFTAHFMAPAMRRYLKPLIELMEAMPTVILGFLGALWLAPLMEVNMVGVFSLFLLLPIATLAVAFLWYSLPLSLSAKVPSGWQVVLLAPVLVLVGYLCLALSPILENQLFGGDFIAWLTYDMGVDFQQRNALVVGVVMGFAVIPTIFSIAEDAIFSVPSHLTMGSLALGARPWQTLLGVVLPVASPAIFSALMIGFGRAIGETMIVLIASGNTPIMDLNLFEGMRTMAANIAIEVPEAEVRSTHYRILFLAGLILFGFTLVFNTAAEILRQRLRDRYGKL